MTTLPPEQHVAERRFVLQLPDGKHFISDERYFVVRTESTNVLNSKWTSHEKQVMAEHKLVVFGGATNDKRYRLAERIGHQASFSHKRKLS